VSKPKLKPYQIILLVLFAVLVAALGFLYTKKDELLTMLVGRNGEQVGDFE
jgi:hypothetical protein